MSIPFLLTGDDWCFLAREWGLSDLLAQRLLTGASRLEFPISIISGLRSAEQQDSLREAGRPTAPNDLSTHLACPATGADVWPQIGITNVVKARLGAEMVFAGLRWGGGSAIDPELPIPTDWEHFDLGPRN